MAILRAYKDISLNSSGTIILTVPVNAINATLFDLRISYEATNIQQTINLTNGVYPYFAAFVKDQLGNLIYRFTPNAMTKSDVTSGTILIANNYTKLNPGDTIYVSCTKNQAPHIYVFGAITYETY